MYIELTTSHVEEKQPTTAHAQGNHRKNLQLKNIAQIQLQHLRAQNKN